jgi:hypothetical protein
MDVREEHGPTVVPQGMIRNVNLGQELRAKINSFCILNMQVMRPWMDKYNTVRLSIEHECARIWHESGRCAPLSSHDIEFSQTIMPKWVHVEMDRFDQFEHRAAIMQDE